MKNPCFEHLSSSTMPIGGWWGPHVASEGFCNTLQEKYFRLLHECGVNVITVSPDTWDTSPEAVSTALDYCEKYNIGYFVRHKAIKKCTTAEQILAMAEPYIYRRGCMGIHIADEPKAVSFDELAAVYKKFAALRLHNKYLYTNLFPNYAKDLSGSEEKIDFTQYAELFLSKVPSAFLSYDFYIFYKAGQGLTDSRLYFKNLSDAAAVCKRNRVPLWVFVQAGGQWNDDGNGAEHKKIFPSLGEFLWNVNTCLAYGAKSVQYFPLMQPEVFSKLKNGERDYRKNGLFGADGRKNRFYRYACIANKRIGMVDEYLMKAEFCGVIGTGVSAVHLGKERLSEFREVKGIGEGAIAGCFDMDGKTLLYIVNDDVKNSRNIQIQFDAVQHFFTAQEGIAMGKGKFAEIFLSPGEGAALIVGK